MAPFLETNCAACGTTLIVGQAETFKEVGDQFGLEMEMKLALGNTDGESLVWADVHRIYRCPECGHEAVLPPIEG